MVQKNKLSEEEHLAELSGENEVMSVRFQVPLLKFNGKTGKFQLFPLDQEGKAIPKPKEEKDEIRPG